MADEEKKPRKGIRRAIGATATVLGVIGGLISMTPGAPVAFNCGTLPVTWPMLGSALCIITGTNVFSWGLGKAQERDKKV